jgi:DNA-binding transcriptional ArsR family regulator
MISKTHTGAVAFAPDPEDDVLGEDPTELDTAETGTDTAEAATSAETRERITMYSARGYAVYRHVLVQLPDRDAERESTLGRMVTARQRRELLLYMLILTAWPWLQKREKPFPSDVWTRALSIDDDERDATTRKNALTWSPSTLSRSWKTLENLGLIEPRGKREDRWVRITPRREDASDAYSIPAGRTDHYNRYFTLPDRFWLGGDFARLALPGLAMLLIIAKETSNKAEVWLTQESVAKWYGISRSTVQSGLKELTEAGLLHTRVKTIKAPLSPNGITKQIHYSLTGDYGYEARRAQRGRAKKVGDDKRLKKAAEASEAIG